MERKRILNISLWVIALLVINVIWWNVASNEASQQLNDRGFEFQPERQVSLQAVFGSDAELPISITTEFVHQDDPTRTENVSWRLLDESNNVVLSWEGSTNEIATSMQNCHQENILSTRLQVRTLSPFNTST